MTREARASIGQPGADQDDAEAFAQRFLEWCVSIGQTGKFDWPHVVNLASEFAEFENLKAPSAMKLSKALSACGISGRMRYLKSGEVGYRAKKEKGVQRPRVRELHIASTAQHRFLVVGERYG